MAPNAEKIFDTSFQTRNLEIGLLWQRSLFFWGFIAAAFVAYADVVKERHYDPDLALAISSFGLVCSVAWTLANRGSKYWQNAWERNVENYEKDALGIDLFKEVYRPTKWWWWGVWLYEWRYSVSRLTTALSDFTVGLWIVLGAKTIPGLPWPKCLKGVWVIPLVTFLYIGAMLKWGKSEQRDQSSEQTRLPVNDHVR